MKTKSFNMRIEEKLHKKYKRICFDADIPMCHYLMEKIKEIVKKKGKNEF